MRWPWGLSAGAICSANGDCVSNSCVDGMCCDKPCAGCNACKNTLTGVDDGTCAPVSLGLDPHAACADETSSNPCGNDGTCDGKGLCHKVSNGKVCAAATCNGTNFTPAATCDGAGTCATSTPQSCGAFQCALTGCLKTCTKDADCGTTNYCSAAGTCATKLALGVTATAGSQCTSGIVADSVCCDTLVCTGCLACTSTLNGQAVSTTGQCLPVMAGKPGHGTCTAAPPCGLDGMCDGNGACHYTPAATSCATDSCLGSTLTTSACDGVKHACVASSNACQADLVCASTSACKKTCTADSDCITGDYCASGACTAKLALGVKCGATNQCKNGNCVEGVCCDSACGQTCRSCLGSKTGVQDGTCANMTPGSACTGGVCNSTTSTTPACEPCVQGNSCPPTNVCKTGKLDCSTGAPVCKEDQPLDTTHACGPAASCNTTTNQATRAQMCDGVGGCAAPIVDTCNYGCNGAVCAPPKTQGTACASTAECASGLSCADGYCCNNACTDSCQACNVTGYFGTCTTLSSGGAPHANHPGCAGQGICKGACNGLSSCSYPGAETTCIQASCTAQTQTYAALCPGNSPPAPGICPTATTKGCNGYGCNGAVCANGAGVGGTCSATALCSPGLTCVANVCCSTACGTCHSCSTGTCYPLSVGAACTTTGSTSGVCDATGTCNACSQGSACTTGINTDCQTGTTDCSSGYPVCNASNKANGTACGAGPSCSSAYYTGQSTCQTGVCTAPTPTKCTSGSCSGTTQCVSCATTPGASLSPTGISYSGATTVCAGQLLSLFVSGGSLGTGGAFWAWYANSTSGTRIGTGPALTVPVTSNTTYYVRAEGPCNITSPASKTVFVYPNPPQVAILPQSYAAPCGSGDYANFTASLSGGATAASAQWHCQNVLNCDNRYYIGATTLVLQVAPAWSDVVSCTIVDNCGNPGTSGPAYLTVPDPSSCP